MKQKCFEVSAEQAVYLTSGLAVLYFFYRFSSTDWGMEILDISSEVQLKAIDLYFDKIKLLSSLSISILGGLWAFVFIERENLHRRHLFALINILYVIVIILFLSGQGFVAGRMFNHKTFEMGAPIIRLWDNSQNCLFFLAVVWTIVWLFKEKSASG